MNRHRQWKTVRNVAEIVTDVKLELAEAKAHIEQLTAERDRLREAQQWIPVSERLPEHDVIFRRGVDEEWTSSLSVLVAYYGGYDDDVFLDIAHHEKDSWRRIGQRDSETFSQRVTHWMSLPKPPSSSLLARLNSHTKEEK
jgi:hypothetical protein